MKKPFRSPWTCFELTLWNCRHASRPRIGSSRLARSTISQAPTRGGNVAGLRTTYSDKKREFQSKRFLRRHGSNRAKRALSTSVRPPPISWKNKSGTFRICRNSLTSARITMASLQELENAIDAMLGHPLGVGNYQLVQHVRSKAYEAYIFALCLRAVRELGVTPVLRGISGSPNPFIFRGGHGQIHSQTLNYGYAEFTMNGHDFEIHVNVEFSGTSEMTHEVDVAIMRAADAIKSRQQVDDPPSASLIGGWECKFYTGTLDKSLGREFVGLVDDFGSNLRIDGLCSNVGHPELRLYFRPSGRPHPHFQLTPLQPSNENIFVNQLKGVLRKMTAS